MHDTHAIKTNEPIDTTPYGVTVIPDNRLNFLAAKCKETLQKTPGNILEVGVYKGGTLIKLAQTLKEICPEFKAYGIDTFTGHPYTDNHPVHPKGKYADVEISDLRCFIKSKDLDSWITLFQGKVEEVLETLNLQNIAFAHIDCDLYIPVKYCAEYVPRILNRNGVIFFDDYGHEHCPGATKAIEEVFQKDQLREVYMSDDNTCWSCYIEFCKIYNSGG